MNKYAIYVNHRDPVKCGYLESWVGREPKLTRNTDDMIWCSDLENVNTMLDVLCNIKHVPIFNPEISPVGHSVSARFFGNLIG